MRLSNGQESAVRAPAGVTDDDAASALEWDAFVLAHPHATLYHTWRWSGLASAAFGFKTYRLTVRNAGGQLAGVLPLIEQRGILSGSRLVSLPYVNYGGPLGESRVAEHQLVEEAIELARHRGAGSLEFRNRSPIPDFSTRTDKVTVELTLPGSAESLGHALGSKLRSQIRRADRESLELAIGGSELLDEFYSVFAATMRDLGTPVYPRQFFAILLERLAADCSVVVVRLRGRPAAAALLTHFRDRTEIPWAASLHELRATSVNMRLYWECIVHAIGRGSRIFDFGRSTADSGTHHFKLQWGGKTQSLHWVYPLASTTPQAGHGRLMEAARTIWSRLPLAVANRLGPLISPGLPW